MRLLSLIFLLSLNFFSHNFSQSYWEKLTLPSSDSLRLCRSDSTGGIFAIFTDGSLFHSSDQGKNWFLMSNNNINSQIYYVVVGENNEIFARVNGPGGYSGPGYYIIYSYDFGVHWDTLTSNYYGFEFGHHFYNPANGSIYISSYDFYSSIGGISFTQDFGMTWYQIPNTRIISYYITIHWLYLKENKIALGQFNRIYKSTNDGFNWNESIDLGNDYEDINDIASDGFNKLYVLFQNSGVFKGDFDDSTYFFLGLGNKKLSSLALNDSLLFVSSDSLGVFKYDFFSKNWINVSDGLLDYEIRKVFFDKSGNLYAEAENNVYLAKENLTSVSSRNSFLYDFYLRQNYPNPFNPSTKIKYSVNRTQKVSLKVYDLLGREIAVLVNKEKPAGEYEIEFDGTGLTSGIYFYQLRVGDFVEMKKMILLK